MIAIKTKLLQENEVDYLEFTFAGGDTKRININDSSDNATLKSVFNQIIELAIDSDVNMEELKIDKSMKGGLLADVFTEYITDLNLEIGKIRAELRIEGDDDE